jgi:hypothetical protein
MKRFKGILSWRHLRWVAMAAVVPALWACNARKLAPPEGVPKQVVKHKFQQAVNRDLDLLFLIDDSSSMAPLQMKMRQRLPDFMDVLKNLPGGLPNVQVAVVSSSLGAGVFANVTGCPPPVSPGNLDGNFQHKAGCGLNAGETFIKSLPPPGAGMPRAENFTGDIATVFACMADLGQGGCGFEHQFEAVRLALQKAEVPGTENYGFLRKDAYLAIIFLTNEDDCSVPADSMLFDPNQQTTMDMLGGLQSYRCNEFGHKCDTMLPHAAPGAPQTMTGCKSAEDGKLVTVDGFVQFLQTLKASPDQLLLAAIQGPVEPYVVESKVFQLANGGMESQPTIKHSCTSGTAEYADPGVRIKQALDPFPGSVIESICANDFRMSMVKIAEVIGAKLGGQCVAGMTATKMNGDPDCDVTQRTYSVTGVPMDTGVPFCHPGDATRPCWEFLDAARQGNQCNGQKVLNICYDANCDPAAKPTSRTDALISCAIDE